MTATHATNPTPPAGVPLSGSELNLKIRSITHPDKALMKYYALVSIVFPPLFPILIVVLYFRYHTMRYRFTEEGISMSWGILFRREIIVNYARIQDIHLNSNIVERWLGLARILVQTASGNRAAEMTIEGIQEFEALRDFLYAKTRGVKDHPVRAAASLHVASSSVPTSTDELTAALRETARELRAVREALEKQDIRPKENSRHV